MSSRPAARDLRASDADRDRVARALAQAASDGRLTLDEHEQRVRDAYAARTLGELARLTQDLAPPSEQPLRLDAPRSVTALFGRQERQGRWVVPARLAATAVGGQVVLDLREALLRDRHTVVHATAIGGQIHVVAPEGVRVVIVPSGTSRDGPPQPPPEPAPGGALIEVRAFTLLGQVRAHTPRSGGRRWLGLFPRRARRLSR